MKLKRQVGFPTRVENRGGRRRHLPDDVFDKLIEFLKTKQLYQSHYGIHRDSDKKR